MKISSYELADIQWSLSFDDILIVPDFSDLESRNTPEPGVFFSELGLGLEVPLVSANMDSVTDADMAIAMARAGGLGVIHRFMSKDDLYDSVAKVANDTSHSTPVAASIGLSSSEVRLIDHVDNLKNAGCQIIVIDVAHGYTKKMMENVTWIKNAFGEGIKVIAGNIATAEAAERLASVGADGVKVGIGPGAACTTRGTTGIGVGQVTAIVQASDGVENFVKKNPGKEVIVIADGGVKNTGDFCKAIALGADLVMAGSIFAGADEAASEFEYEQAPASISSGWLNQESSKRAEYKIYRGMASKDARDAFGFAGAPGYNEYVPEGISGRVPASGPVSDIITQYRKALQTSMSYIGAFNIKEFQGSARFTRVASGVNLESSTRV